MIQWSDIQDAEQRDPKGNLRTIKVKVPLGENPPRFVLYQQSIPTMWALHDFQTKTTHYLCGVGWEGAQVAAEKRITEKSAL